MPISLPLMMLLAVFIAIVVQRTRQSNRVIAGLVREIQHSLERQEQLQILENDLRKQIEQLSAIGHNR